MKHSPELTQALTAEIERLEGHVDQLHGQIEETEAALNVVRKFRDSESAPGGASPEPVKPAATPKAAPAPRVKVKSKRPTAQKPNTTSPTPASSDVAESVQNALRTAGIPLSKAALANRVTANDGQLKTALAQLVDQGKITKTGKTAGTRYSIPSQQVAGAAPAKKPEPRPTGTDGLQEPLLDGRIYSRLRTQELTVGELATALGEPVALTQQTLNKLKAEGDVRCSGRAPFLKWSAC
jgi:DNA-binding FrmR family transcriptional regulator